MSGPTTDISGLMGALEFDLDLHRQSLADCTARLEKAWRAQPRDRHFRRIPECPRVIELHETCDFLREAIAWRERRIAETPARLARDPAAAAWAFARRPVKRATPMDAGMDDLPY